MTNNVKNISITGAAGNIAYSAVFRIASGELYGKDTKINFKLIDISDFEKKMFGVKLELLDCAFPLLNSVEVTSDLNKGFGDADCIFLFGAKPRGKGMERKDLLESNANIFSIQGKAINDNANKNVKVIVVGNPANTNALILSKNAKNINPSQITSMMRLDHDRAKALVAEKTGIECSNVKNSFVWGNHSSTQVPDITNIINAASGESIFVDSDWMINDFIPRIQKRGAEIISYRGLSSAASAANAAISHMKDLLFGSKDILSVGQYSGDNKYDIDTDLFFSFPTNCSEDGHLINYDFEIKNDLHGFIKETERELVEERDAIKHLL